MSNKMFLFLFFFCLAGACFAVPFFVRAESETWPLKQSQVQGLLDIMRKEPLTEFQREGYFSVLAFDSTAFDRQTGAVVLVKQAILAKELDYWFREGAIKFSKNLIKIVVKLLPALAGDYSGVIKLVEKFTVQQANEYIFNKLSENQTKIGTGQLVYFFDSYRGVAQQFTTTYLITYNSQDKTVIAEFYSNTAIEPPLGTGPNALVSSADNPRTNCWPWDIWLDNEKRRNNDGKLEPFIVRVSGKVQEEHFNQFSWQKGTTPVVEVVFDKPVPVINEQDIEVEPGPENALIKKLLGPFAGKFEKVSDALNKISKAREIADKVLDVVKTIFGTPDTEALISSQLPDPEPIELGQGQTRSQLETQTVVEVKPEPAPKTIQETQNNVELTKSIPPTTTPTTIETGPKTIEPEAKPTPTPKPQEVKPEPKIVASEKPAPAVSCQTNTSQSPSHNPLVFNEVAWMGGASRGPSSGTSTNSANDEWLELKNISAQTINVFGWQVMNQKQTIKISLENFNLNPQSILLLERTDDNSVAGVKADQIYTGAIANTEEALYLFNSGCVLQDKVQANPYWPSGDNSVKKTMERKADLTWQTSKEIGGTPRKENSEGEASPTGGPARNAAHNTAGGGGGAANSAPLEASPPTGQAPTTATATTTATTTQPAEPTRVVISEIQIANDEATNNDFIELFNQTATQADISGFKLKKKSSTGSEYSIKVLPEASIIPGNGYFLWANSDYTAIAFDVASSQTLSANNSVALLDANDNIQDQAAWGQGENQFVETTAFPESPEKGTSLARKWIADTNTCTDTNNNQTDFEIGLPTPKAKNIKKEAAVEEQQNATTSTAVKTRPGFQDNQDGTLTDLFTGLIWPKDTTNVLCAFGASSTQYDAQEYLTAFNATSSFAGFSDWRLPNIKEMASLLTYVKEGVFLSDIFEGLQKTFYWGWGRFMTYQSGFPGDPSSFKAWRINMETGKTTSDVFNGSASPMYPFLAVRGPEIPGVLSSSEIPLTDNKDGTATDERWGLMWAGFSSALAYDGQRKTWDTANNFASNRVLCKDGSFTGNE